MILLTGTSDLVQVITSAAVSTIYVHASYVDHTTTTFTPGRTNVQITTATTTTIVASPAGSTQRQVKTLTIRNSHASSSNTITIQHTDGSTVAELLKYTLLAGETIQYADGEGFTVINSSGSRRLALSEASGTVPIGGIIMWNGSIASIPSGWALCDGTANSPGPDLRDKFVVCAKQDDGGVAKTNIEGSLKVTGGVTGHLHSDHANLSHSGLSISDHTGMTHSLNIGDHPDLTHPALSHAAQTITHPDHSVASASHSHAAITLTHADHSLASFSGTHAAFTLTHADHSLASFTGTHASQTGSVASGTHSHASTAGVASFASSTNRSGLVSAASFSGTHASQTLTIASGTHSHAAQTVTHADHSVASASHTHAAQTVTHADHSVASFSGSAASYTLSHADHSLASLSHQNIGTHLGTSYGTHAITQPGGHGTAGTVVHAFSESSAHDVSVHDTVLSLPNYYALAFIQRMS